MATLAVSVAVASVVAQAAAGLGFAAAADLSDWQSLDLVDSRCSVGSVAETWRNSFRVGDQQIRMTCCSFIVSTQQKPLCRNLLIKTDPYVSCD